MRHLAKLHVCALSLLIVGGVALASQGYKALAQDAATPAAIASPQATVNDPPGPPPDPTHRVIKLSNQIKWTGNEALLYGTPNQPNSFYGLLVKLNPGQFSAPHAIANNRWVYVVSGTWWVSSSDSFDLKSTYPVKATSFVTDLANTVHWDGNRAGATEPTTLFICGIGSADNDVMGEYSRKIANAGIISVNDPSGPAPDPSHITIAENKIKGALFGPSNVDDVPYGEIQQWAPGRYSHPHFHFQARYIYVLRGPWWVSTSSVFDPRLTYPVPTGSFVVDIPHEIHWDGNRLGAPQTTLLLITGIGPEANHPVDENGNELPPRAGRGGTGRGNAGDAPDNGSN